MSFIVLAPGIESRIVAAGRLRSRSLGVPVGGAADRCALAIGNALVGNPPAAPGLEVALQGPRLRAEADVGCVVFGAPFSVHVDGNPVIVGHTFLVRAGQELHIGGTAAAARAYLCVRGGFETPTILASRSALESIHKGIVLRCQASAIHHRFDGECIEVPPHEAVSVLPGLQSPWFDESEFYTQSFAVTPASNRMGIRLNGKPLTVPKREMISEAVCPGAVQVTNEGQCIILGVDGQTIGGYPKIAQVIQADLDVLGQLRPGQSIRFTKVTLDEATQREREAQKTLREWTMRLRLALDAFPAASKY